jgi:hypothetical protein
MTLRGIFSFHAAGAEDYLFHDFPNILPQRVTILKSRATTESSDYGISKTCNLGEAAKIPYHSNHIQYNPHQAIYPARTPLLDSPTLPPPPCTALYSVDVVD